MSSVNPRVEFVFESPRERRKFLYGFPCETDSLRDSELISSLDLVPLPGFESILPAVIHAKPTIRIFDDFGSHFCRADVGNDQVVLKFMFGTRVRRDAEREANNYATLVEMQGKTIAHFKGVYSVAGDSVGTMCLITSYVGDSVSKRLPCLPKDDRLVIFSLVHL